MTLKLTRDQRALPDKLFLVTAFGKRTLPSGKEFDFDYFYEEVLKPACADLGKELVRCDQIFGQGDVAESAWYGIQRASAVLVDFTGQRPNVAAEFALALAAGKHIIVLTQDPADIPSDVRGHYRYIEYADSMASSQKVVEELKREIPAVLEQPSNEMVFVPIASPSGEAPVEAKVLIAEKDFLIVETPDRRRLEMTANDVDYRRVISDMAQRFPVGSRLQGSVEVDLAGRARYTMLAGRVNPWPAIEAKFSPGTEFVGKVESVRPGIGVFVHVAHGVNGLIPESRLEGRAVVAGQEVSVAVTTCDTQLRRVGLRLDRVSQQSSQPSEAADAILTVGQRTVGTPVKIAPEGQGGYILLEVPERAKPVMLHCTAMSQDLRADLNTGNVDYDEEFDIEILHVDQRTGKATARDIPEAPEAADAA